MLFYCQKNKVYIAHFDDGNLTTENTKKAQRAQRFYKDKLPSKTFDLCEKILAHSVVNF